MCDQLERARLDIVTYVTNADGSVSTRKGGRTIELYAIIRRDGWATGQELE
jgi:hypothetical protein